MRVIWIWEQAVGANQLDPNWMPYFQQIAMDHEAREAVYGRVRHVRSYETSMVWFDVPDGMIWILSLHSPSVMGRQRPQDGAQDEVPWIESVQITHEETAHPSFREPIPTFQDLQELEEWKLQTDKRWRVYLGAFENRSSRGLGSLEWLESREFDGLLERRIRYETEPGCFVEAFVLEPADPSQKRKPGVVVFHSTVSDSILQPVGRSFRDSDPNPSDPFRKRKGTKRTRCISPKEEWSLSPAKFFMAEGCGVRGIKTGGSFFAAESRTKGDGSNAARRNGRYERARVVTEC